MKWSKEITEIMEDIKSVRIQGATNVAKGGVKAVEMFVRQGAFKDVDTFILGIEELKNALLSLRETEPMLRNSLNYVTGVESKNSVEEVKKDVLERISKVRERFKNARKKITEIGASVIKNGMNVYTHCHSSTVTGILLEAKKGGKRFKVYNTETRPLFQGRITAKELSKNGIDVVHMVDSAVLHALKKADIMLIGCDAITERGIYNKVGSRPFSILAKKYGVPVFVCTDSWKFSDEEIKIEERAPEEVWKKSEKRIKILNPAFEFVEGIYIEKVISEFGVLTFDSFLKKVKGMWAR